ncbi:fatty-acid amide hydrolase 2-A [Caerostris extrusa]|uniref:Fatty-acid amide hydrolase 2-A n=1 Tax=Caerostris extrusa TaxID=172846 RepID=A0AAV4RAZ3_CAEEX|nr:fatty-acid amide hydrolase 2-A [Caerostris extrusa]
MNVAQFPIWCRKDQNTYFEKIENQWIKEFDSLLDEDTVLLMPTLPFPASYHCGMVPKLTVVCYTGIFNVLGLPVTQCPLGFNKEGLPHGIQIVGSKNNDPLTIACAVELEKTFGGWKSPSRK